MIYVFWFLFSCSGTLACVKLFTIGHYKKHWKTGEYIKEGGFDISLCTLSILFALSFFPPYAVLGNLFWLWVLRQQIKRRPLIKWPKWNFPIESKIKWPECPIVFKGEKSDI